MKARWWVLGAVLLFGGCSAALAGPTPQTMPVSPAPLTTPAFTYVPPTPVAPEPLPAIEEPEEVDAPVYVENKKRSGKSGHPCLPGERDGDGDGYCVEGR